MGRVVVVRHGQASIHAADYDQLCPQGEAQSKLLGQWWAQQAQRFDAVFVGPAKRHRQTHAAVADSMPELPPPSAMPGLAEHDAFGLVRKALPLLADDPEFAAHAQALMTAKDPAARSRGFQRVFEAVMLRWLEGSLPLEGIEPWPVFRDRVNDAFETLAQAAADGRVVVAFSSVGPVAAMLHHVLGCSAQRAFATGWRLRNAAITEFVVGRAQPCLHAFNSVPHLSDADMHTFR